MFAFECLCCSFAFLKEGVEKSTGMVDIKAEVFITMISYRCTETWFIMCVTDNDLLLIVGAFASLALEAGNTFRDFHYPG